MSTCCSRCSVHSGEQYSHFLHSLYLSSSPQVVLITVQLVSLLYNASVVINKRFASPWPQADHLCVPYQEPAQRRRWRNDRTMYEYTHFRGCVPSVFFFKKQGKGNGRQLLKSGEGLRKTLGFSSFERSIVVPWSGAQALRSERQRTQILALPHILNRTLKNPFLVWTPVSSSLKCRKQQYLLLGLH